MKIYLQLTVFSTLVLPFLLGCASTAKLEKQMFSNNDSLRAEAWYKYDRNIVKIRNKRTTHYIQQAKYGNPSESLMSFELLAHTDDIGVLAYGPGILGCPWTDFGKKVTVWHNQLISVDERCINNYLNAIDSGSVDAKKLCIIVLGQAHPIYTSVVDRLFNIMRANTFSIATKETQLPLYAYKSLKMMRMISDTDTLAKYDSLFQIKR